MNCICVPDADVVENGIDKPCSIFASLLSSALTRGVEITLPSPVDSSAERTRSRFKDLLIEPNVKPMAPPPVPAPAGAGMLTKKLPDPEGVAPMLGPPVMPTEFGNDTPSGLPCAASDFDEPPHCTPR